MQRMSSQNWFWPEWPWPCGWIRAAQFSRFRPAKACRNLVSCGGKNKCAQLGPFHLDLLEPVLFGRTDSTNGKRARVQSPRFNFSRVFREAWTGPVKRVSCYRCHSIVSCHCSLSLCCALLCCCTTVHMCKTPSAVYFSQTNKHIRN